MAGIELQLHHQQQQSHPPTSSIWTQMSYTPPRGPCSQRTSLVSTCPCHRFMIHPLKASSSFDCDGCGHHASFHRMESKEEEEVVRRWRAEEEEMMMRGGVRVREVGVVGGGEKNKKRRRIDDGGGGSGEMAWRRLQALVRGEEVMEEVGQEEEEEEEKDKEVQVTGGRQKRKAKATR